MPMRLQVKLLRVLQENAIRPVGGADVVQTNVRIISATHRDLHELMVAGQFREDLYYRLNVVHIEVPSLGRRREDIPLLVAHFLEQIAKESGQRKIYAPEAVELLATAEWPGNVRQLYNVVRQNVALSNGPIITAELVQQSLGGNPIRLPSFDEAREAKPSATTPNDAVTPTNTFVCIDNRSVSACIDTLTRACLAPRCIVSSTSPQCPRRHTTVLRAPRPGTPHVAHAGRSPALARILTAMTRSSEAYRSNHRQIPPACLPFAQSVNLFSRKASKKSRLPT